MELINIFIILPFFIILCYGVVLIRQDINDLKEQINKRL